MRGFQIHIYIVIRNTWIGPRSGTFGSAVPKVLQYLFAAMMAQGTSQPGVDYYLVNRSGCRGGPASRRSWHVLVWERHGPELCIRSSLVMIDDHSQTCFVRAIHGSGSVVVVVMMRV